MDIHFPSPDAPAFPQIGLGLAEGWVPVAAPGSVLAARRPLDDGRFSPNLQVTVTRHLQEWTVEDEMATVEEGLASLVDAEVHPVDPPDLEVPDGAGVGARLVAHRDPEAGPLVQIVVVVHVPQGYFADVVHCIGTLHEDSEVADREELKSILAALSVSLPHSSGQDAS